MFTRIPSPLLPLTVAVTTTNVSLATKFRIHLSLRVSCDWEVAWRSNLRACAQATNRTILQTYCSSDRGSAMLVGRRQSMCDQEAVVCCGVEGDSRQNKLVTEHLYGNCSQTANCTGVAFAILGLAWKPGGSSLGSTQSAAWAPAQNTGLYFLALPVWQAWAPSSIQPRLPRTLNL